MTLGLVAHKNFTVGGGSPSYTQLATAERQGDGPTTLDIAVTVPAGSTGLVASCGSTGQITGVAIVSGSSFTQDCQVQANGDTRWVAEFSLASPPSGGCTVRITVTGTFNFIYGRVYALSGTTGVAKSANTASAGATHVECTVTTANTDLVFASVIRNPNGTFDWNNSTAHPTNANVIDLFDSQADWSGVTVTGSFLVRADDISGSANLGLAVAVYGA